MKKSPGSPPGLDFCDFDVAPLLVLPRESRESRKLLESRKSRKLPKSAIFYFWKVARKSRKSEKLKRLQKSKVDDLVPYCTILYHLVPKSKVDSR